jgi:predicted dehydrogenase
VNDFFIPALVPCGIIVVSLTFTAYHFSSSNKAKKNYCMKNIKSFLFFFSICIQQICFAQQKLKVVIAGLSHDHVNRMLDKGRSGDIIIIGIAETNQQLCSKKKTDYQLPDSLFYKNLSSALKKNHPDLVMVYNAPVEHLAAIETCMPLHIPVMVEKPLCFSNAEAAKIKTLSQKFKTKVFTNYPSLWYSSFIELLNKKKEVGIITKMEMHGGHKGPAEIGCSKDFLNWLTDPQKNGGGAITDFGCYGACIMTELMNEKMPASVYATVKNLKPSVYPKVDDDATIVLEYTGATGIIEASWNWPYTIMDAEVYGNNAYLHASQINGTDTVYLQSKNEKGTKQEIISTPQYKDEVEYLTAVIKNCAVDSNKLLSLDRNIVIVKILDAAIQSAKLGKKIIL